MINLSGSLVQLFQLDNIYEMYYKLYFIMIDRYIYIYICIYLPPRNRSFVHTSDHTVAFTTSNILSNIFPSNLYRFSCEKITTNKILIVDSFKEN